MNNHKIVFYEDPEHMKIKRFNRFQKNLMIAYEVGSTFEDFDQRTLKVIELLKKKMQNDAVKEFQNMRQAVFNAYQEYSPKSYALALTVKSIDGIEYTDISTEGLDLVLEKLDEIGYTQGNLEEDLSRVKKKFMIRLKLTSRSILKRMMNLTLILRLKTALKRK